MNDQEQKVWEKYPAALPKGTILAGQYVIQDVLGEGGFGITYLAEDYQLKLQVAVKEFFPDSMVMRQGGNLQVTAYTDGRYENFQYGMQSFLDEARVLARFQGNPNIVGVRSYFEENGTAYFVMDYIEGTDFKTYIKEHGGKVSWEEAWNILSKVMKALDMVHKEGVIHRDVTPDNILISKDQVVKLLDFGAARYSLGDRSQSLDVVLKAGYAPKEQYLRRGRQGPYTDVYSVAACFYASLCGYLPPESLERMDEDTLVPLSTRGIHLPDGVEEAILKGLEVRAEDRYQNMAEFSQAILNALYHGGTQQTKSSEEPVMQGGKSITEPLKTAQQGGRIQEQSHPSFLHRFRVPLAILASTFAIFMLLGLMGSRNSKTTSTPVNESLQTSKDTVSKEASVDEEQYEGEMNHGLREGQGSCKYADGSVYIGEWKEGKRNGQGLYIWANGDEYEGEWLDDEMVNP